MKSWLRELPRAVWPTWRWHLNQYPIEISVCFVPVLHKPKGKNLQSQTTNRSAWNTNKHVVINGLFLPAQSLWYYVSYTDQCCASLFHKAAVRILCLVSYCNFPSCVKRMWTTNLPTSKRMWPPRSPPHGSHFIYFTHNFSNLMGSIRNMF